MNLNHQTSVQLNSNGRFWSTMLSNSIVKQWALRLFWEAHGESNTLLRHFMLGFPLISPWSVYFLHQTSTYTVLRDLTELTMRRNLSLAFIHLGFFLKDAVGSCRQITPKKWMWDQGIRVTAETGLRIVVTARWWHCWVMKFSNNKPAQSVIPTIFMLFFLQCCCTRAWNLQ